MRSFTTMQMQASLCLVLACGLPLPAQESGGAELDRALKAVAAFTYGKDSTLLELLERQVLAASGDAQRRAALEEKLLGALAQATTRDGKELLCRLLSAIGTARSVPLLEGMLRDAELSALARFALERIEAPEAGAALVRSLPGTTGKVLTGILGSIGRRRDRAAAPEVAKHLASSDASVARAAAAALGAIGGADAADLLGRARAGATGALAIEIDDALLACAERLTADGAPGEAAKLYRTFLDARKAKHLRLAAVNGLAAAGGAGALDAIVAALRDVDPEIRLGAIEACIAVDRGSEATTRALAAVLPSLTPELQALIVPAIASRGGDAALAAILGSAAAEHESVRTAAFEALGRIGGPVQVEMLLRAAAGAAPAGEKTAAAARASLLQLRGEEVDLAIARAVAAGDAAVRREGIRALAARRAAGSFARVLPLAADDDAAMRQEAIAALGVLASAGEIGSLTALVVKPRDAADRPGLEKAVADALLRLPAGERSAEPLLAALRGAPVEARPPLVRLLGRVASPAALGAVKAALADSAPETSEAAVRTLADWPDAAPMEDLLRLASTLPNLASKQAALRGYVRLAGLSTETIEPYRKALAVATRPEERAMVLEGLSGAALPEALDLVEPLLGQVEAAARAAVAIADRIRGLDATRARAAVEKALAATTDAEIKRRGHAIIEHIEKYQGHVLAWAISGPYREDGKDARAIFDAVLPPEAPGGEAAWRRLRRGVGAWDIDLARALGPADNVAACMRSTITAPRELEARLELGSDDAVKAWLNGTLVHAHYTSRSLEVASDRVNVRLREGPNELLIKVVNQGGPWGFSCRLRAADGSLLRDLKVEPAMRVAASDAFVPLFDGKALEGWEQKGGKATYRVEDGAIVGRTVPNTPNSFLCTRKVYGDFVLEYEFRCDAALNSGVQIRSQALEAETSHEVEGKKIKVPAGRVHGYQVEIDPDKPERSWVGGVYDEGRCGWLYPGSRGGDAKAFSEQGRRLYRKGEWNQVRVEARGPAIKTWLNGELRADLQDEMTLRGFIALQVHGVGGRQEPLEVRWRNLRIRELATGSEGRQ
jgi:HEAT repeat protein